MLYSSLSTNKLCTTLFWPNTLSFFLNGQGKEWVKNVLIVFFCLVSQTKSFSMSKCMFVYFHASASEQVILKWKMSYKQRFFPCVNLSHYQVLLRSQNILLDNNKMFLLIEEEQLQSKSCQLYTLYFIFIHIILPSQPENSKSQTRRAERKGYSSHNR